ncbi:MAG: YXWGXW repeat-containing protein [Dysgonamonadaceae bacterium]|jgi:hypothetical protein|nr:YXWGXW repeat-containing protein [Dysgonamonadaceae bacterium]
MKSRKLLFLSAFVFVLIACSVNKMAEAQVHIGLYARIPLAPDIVVTIEAPIIAAPGPNYVWIDGYWTWDNRYREYVWVQSHWALVPYQGAYWIPGYWELYGGRYRWIDACWLPRDYAFRYGYYNGRYDYYGRPIYYPRPNGDVRVGYAYAYDHRPDFRGSGYSSARAFNDEPRNVREQITREYKQEAKRSSGTVSTRNATTSRNSQKEIRIRESVSRNPSSSSESGVNSSSSTRRSSVDNSGTSRTESGNANVSTRSSSNNAAGTTRSSSVSPTTRSSSGNSSGSTRSSSSSGTSSSSRRR